MLGWELATVIGLLVVSVAHIFQGLAAKRLDERIDALEQRLMEESSWRQESYNSIFRNVRALEKHFGLKLVKKPEKFVITKEGEALGTDEFIV